MPTSIPAKAYEQGHKSWVDLNPAWGPAMRVSHEIFLPGSSGDQVTQPIPVKAFKEGKRAWIELYPKGRRPMRVTHEFMGLEQPFAEAEKQENARRAWADFVLTADQGMKRLVTLQAEGKDAKPAAAMLARLLRQIVQLVEANPSIQAGFAPGEWPQIAAALRGFRWGLVRDRLFQIGDLVSSVAPEEVATLLHNAALARDLPSAPAKSAPLKGLSAAPDSLGWLGGAILVGAAYALVMWVASEPSAGEDEVESDEDEQADLAPRGRNANARAR